MSAVVSVLEYHLVNYRRTWRGSAVSTFVLPLLMLLGFGVGVGSYVDGGVAGVPYLDWLVPGLIASVAVQTAIFEATWPVFSYFRWMRVYYAQAAAPLRVADVLGGHVAFVAFRVLVAASAFLLVAAVFGALHAVWAPAVLPVAVLTALAVTTPVFAYTAVVPSDSFLAILMRVGVLPMSLFSGVFFPVESLPGVLRWIAYALPLWHGVDLSRAATLGVAPDWSVTGHLVYLVLWTVAGWWLAVRVFARKLVV